MAKRRTANVSLTPELEAFVEALVASGRYQSASEVVREGLRLVEQRDRRRVRSIEDLRREVALGMDEALRGDVVDGPSTIRRLRAGIARRSAHSRRHAG